MLRRGTKVVRRTKKVGQVAATGKVIATHDYSVEIEWDDGHKSIISKEAVTLLTEANRPQKGT
jgi:preprotein translocase subunit YajC